MGKTSRATLALFGLWAIILWRLSDSPLLDTVLLGGGVICTCAYGWWVHRTQRFAAENPGLALMEGAQLLEYQKWEAGIKGLPALNSPIIPDPEKSQPLIDAESQGA